MTFRMLFDSDGRTRTIRLIGQIGSEHVEAIAQEIETAGTNVILDLDEVTLSFWLQGMRAGMPASYFCIKAFSETDLTEDLKKFDVPTLIMHGDDDQIVPIRASALLSSKIVKGSTLKVYPGLSHGMCTINKDQINTDLLAFIKS